MSTCRASVSDRITAGCSHRTWQVRPWDQCLRPQRSARTFPCTLRVRTKTPCFHARSTLKNIAHDEWKDAITPRRGCPIRSIRDQPFEQVEAQRDYLGVEMTHDARRSTPRHRARGVRTSLHGPGAEREGRKRRREHVRRARLQVGKRRLGRPKSMKKLPGWGALRRIGEASEEVGPFPHGDDADLSQGAGTRSRACSPQS